MSGSSRTARLVALDWMRGLVMLLMAVDHSSAVFNAAHFAQDDAASFSPGTPLPTVQFLSRWTAHLCAPTFVFLAGASLALSISHRTASGESAWDIDKHLLLRGVVILAFEGWFSLFWVGRHRVLLQVLYAIGISVVAMVPLRRLSTGMLVGLGAVIVALSEWVVSALGWQSQQATPLGLLLLVPGDRGAFVFRYPALPWLSVMLFGWAFGRFLARGPGARATERLLVSGGAALLALFVVVRAQNGYGNAGLFREGGSLLQWLHVSKYPPSLSYVTLELGVMALLLAGFWVTAERTQASENGLFIVLGRTPMFFYLLHVALLVGLGRVLHLTHRLGLAGAYLFAAAVVAVLYPLCRRYGRYKAVHPTWWTRYL
jgi:uncharacterized membrane protein